MEGRLRDGGKEGCDRVRTLASLHDRVSPLLFCGTVDALWWRDEGSNGWLGSRSRVKWRHSYGGNNSLKRALQHGSGGGGLCVVVVRGSGGDGG
ncbi:hypothetical protein LR48_Vigan07g063900 [Vigna angularis]|uniref:Uncharacterized protein n=1 Tax=Phaseolus angularis TaxID=3914 RepID=A0A0L9UVQ5_PHAAN|nr:hypothetical protein LR48_Vigan07g063900 [Vigna angularis]